MSTRVRSLSNHPYRGRMQIKGDEYDADDADLDLLVALDRVVPVEPRIDERAYSTRELQASSPEVTITRTRRRVRQPSAPPPVLPSSDEE